MKDLHPNSLEWSKPGGLHLTHHRLKHGGRVGFVVRRDHESQDRTIVRILLGDLGSVGIGLRKPFGVAMTNQSPSMVLLLFRESGSNVLEVSQEIRDTVDELQLRELGPEGLTIEVIDDQTGYIQGALDLVQQNLLIGALLAVITLFVFLRSFGASAIISLAIPISVFGTALGMTLLGRSVNVVSLAGITFAIGMVLDNSIVSLESIDTWRARVADPRRAAYLGIKEVWGALVASTATTAAVFVPVIAWEGEVGQLLRDVAVAVERGWADGLPVAEEKELQAAGHADGPLSWRRTGFGGRVDAPARRAACT